jgi:hypothetical protein
MGMDAQHLTFSEEAQFEQVVLHAITSRYAGDLERQEDPRGKEADRYVPVDDIHDLILELWGAYFTPDMLDAFEQQLTEEGIEREHWGPHAYCSEEELEYEEEQRARDAELEQNSF